jgi:transposase-like protein
MDKEPLSTISTSNGRPRLAARPQRKRRAIELYETTNLTSDEIGREVGVSRETVYRWLRKEGVPIRRNRIRHVTDRPAKDVIRLNAVIDELRGDLTILAGEVGRLTGLLEALVERQNAASVAALAA